VRSKFHTYSAKSMPKPTKAFRVGDYLVASDLNTTMVFDMANDEFHVHTPKHDGGKKKKAKYGFLEEKAKFESKYPAKQTIDAIFIAPTIHQCLVWVKQLNYNARDVLMVTPPTLLSKLDAVEPDEDVPVHIVGSWLAEAVPTKMFTELSDVMNFLDIRGFDYLEVPEIGKPS
jgi:hypothetical protein